MPILEMKVPSPGESISEVEIAAWLVSDGDYVEKDQAIAEVDSDKATLELPAEAAGIITLKSEEGDVVEVGGVCCLIDTDAKRPEGTAAPAPAAPAGNSFGRPGETVAFNTLQGAVNRNMEASLAVPCFRVGYTINTDKLDAFYKQVKPKGVTMTALLAKAVAVTLARHPQVNAATTAAGMSYPAEVNVAVAVAMEDGGLITPVLRQADRTDLYDMSRQWADLVKRSRSTQLLPEEYSTGTFTLSNLGMFGVDRFDAILPPGTGAILAVAASRPMVVAGKDGSISVKRQMQVNLTADHRVVYGADGASFLKALADLIENRPESLAL